MLAGRMKGRHELRSIIDPPPPFSMCPIATRRLWRLTGIARHEVLVGQVGSGKLSPAATLRLDMLHMRRVSVNPTHRVGAKPTLVRNHALEDLGLLRGAHLTPVRLLGPRNRRTPIRIPARRASLLDVFHSARISNRAIRASRTDHSGKSNPFCFAFAISSRA